jgi:hypothetical protein
MSEHSMNTDCLVMVSGVLSGNGGIVDLLQRRYTIGSVEELGRFSERPTVDLRRTVD